MKTLPRLVEAAPAKRLGVMPAAVVVTGARQTGKSTLAAERVSGARRAPPAYGRHARMAGAGRAGGALVESSVKRRRIAWACRAPYRFVLDPTRPPLTKGEKIDARDR